MHFEYRKIDTLPRLAWCAEVSRKEEVIVYHGPWVETRVDCFFEAAWDGDFDEGRFDEATTAIGTGARTDGDSILFITPTDIDFHLYTIQHESKLIVSNSLTFAMVRARTSPDIRHPYYDTDFLALGRAGVGAKSYNLRTSSGKYILVYQFVQITVNRKMELKVQPFKHNPPPENFETYVSGLRTCLKSVFENANHPNRGFTFTPISPLSEGYDSSAISALAAELGCRDAICYVTNNCGHDEDARDNARLLGLHPVIARHEDYLQVPGFPEAEFCASAPTGRGMIIAPLEKVLEARILLTGEGGDRIWNLKETDNVSNLRWPQTYTLTPTSMNEFRLRTGSFVINVPIIGAIHRPRIQIISNSNEMKPWSLGGKYDRPIARRIAEGAGLRRESFGQIKKFGMVQKAHQTSLKPESLTDLKQFCHSIPNPSPSKKILFFLHQKLVIWPLIKFLNVLRKTRQTSKLYKIVATPLLKITRHRSSKRKMFSHSYYLFHWGFEKTKLRYEVCGDFEN